MKEFDIIQNYYIYNTKLTDKGEIIIVTSKDKKSCTILLTDKKQEIKQQITLPIPEDMNIFLKAISTFQKIIITPTKKIQITIYADYLTAYKQLYTNKQDKKIIHKIYQDNKKHYQWKEKHLKQFLTGENILNNENYLNTYYTYIRNQLEKDYNIIELNNGKYITIQGVKTWYQRTWENNTRKHMT